MKYTETEIEAALTWYRSTDANWIELRETLWGAAKRTDIDGSYEMIAEKILRSHIEELSSKTS